VLLTQTAYQTGRPMITLPVIAAVAPMASVAIGIGLLGETPTTGIAGGVVAGLVVLIASVALAYLARSAPHPEPQAQVPAPRSEHAGSAREAGESEADADASAHRARGGVAVLSR
jgi:hypothetical protein